MHMMTPKLLSDFPGDPRPSGSQLNYQHCPACGSDAWKLYVNPEDGTWFCFAGSHHAGGQVDMGLTADNPGADILALLDRHTEDPVWSETELPPHGPLTNAARRYLSGRGIMTPDITALGIVEWTNQFRVLIPYFQDGDCVFWTSRRYSDILGSGPKYWSQPGKKPLYQPFLGGASPYENRGFVLVEGVFDAIACAKAGYCAWAIGGKSLPQYHERKVLTRASKSGIMHVMLDTDALVDTFDLWDHLQQRTRAQVQMHLLQGKRDPGDMTPDEIQELLS